ncbi:hypothetical protein [Rothia sp. ZJ1223]|uniref:hypothetical protein n=1 Tax=Rothia sp. ZJ1223 TaxID=2811098 RepID=UPI001EF5F132|nr:hypothetical protein [Rothia sp. ZJ1223]
MTQNISRRSLAKGAAWAAPVVVASSAVPAYAASPNCPSDIDSQVDAVFQVRLAALPDLSGTSIRLWFTNRSGINGGLHTSNLRAQVTNGGAIDAAGLPFGFEFAQRNVATSAAINKLFSGGTIRTARMPVEWPANAKWNTRTGVANSTPRAINVDDPFAANQRDVSHASSFAKSYSADGLYNDLASGEFGEETGVPRGNHLTWILAMRPDTAVTKGSVVDFVNSNWRDGGTGAGGGGAIYTSLGVRPIGYLPPSFEEVRAAVGSSIDETCLVEAYTKRAEAWRSSSERFAGATVEFSGWGFDSTGDVKTVAYFSDDFVYSHEIGAFQGALTGTSFASGDTNAIDFFNKQLVGLTAGQNTQLGYQLMYADGIW